MASSTPWTAEDLRRNSSSWTLEGDAKLLEYMQTISRNLEKRAENTNSMLHDMVLNTQETSVSLENITNKLSALQHSQFVENRVYEDETIISKSKVLIDDQQGKDEYDPIKTLNTVLKNSISMMNNCYQRVSIDIEDSDDEEGLSKSIVYKSKNFFDQKPLPYLIGSKEWKEKWHVGLCDTDEDYSDDENKEEYSDTSENVSLSASLPSNAPTISESENSVWGLHPSTNSKRPAIYSQSSDEEVSSNSMTSKTSSEKINKKINSDKEIIPPTYMLPPQEQKYYIHKPKEKGLFDESSDESDEGDLSSKSQIQPKKQTPYKFANGISNIFSDEPPDLDEVDRNNDNENNQLFYETDVIVNKNQTQNVDRSKEEKLSNIRTKPVNLFDDEDFESFMEELDKKANEKLCQIKKEKNVTNLFDDINQDEPKEAIISHNSVDKQIEIPAAERKNEIEIMKKSPFESETEDNIFENITNKKKIMGTNPRQRSRNLFDDESDDEFESVFRKESQIEAKISQEQTYGITESDTRKFEGGSAQNKTESESHTFTNTLKNEKTNINLFENKNVPPLFPLEEPEDDDLFNEIKKPSESEASNLVGKESQKEESIVKLNVEDLFSNSDDDIFSSKKLPPVPQPRSGNAITPKDGPPSRDVLKTSIENQQPYETVATISSGGNTTAIATKTTLTTNNKQNISKNQFDNSDSDKSKLHSTVKTPKTTANGVSSIKSEKEQIKPKNILSSIFFDDEPPNDNDDDDIFNILPQKKSELDVSVPNSSSKLVKNDVGVSSELCPDYNKKDHSISFDGSNESASEQSVLEKSEETVVFNKFKLPSLFDDETVEDEDFLFSKSIINTQKSVSSTSCEHISDNDNMEYKIIEENKLKSSNEKELIVTALVEDEINNRIVQEELESSGDKNTVAKENTSLKLEDSENAFQQDKELENSINKDLIEPKSSGNFSKPDESPNISTAENNIHKDNLNNFQARGFDINLKSDIADNYDKKQEDKGIAILKESEQIDNNKTSASIFSTINLLQDIPPEDDFQNSTDSKRLHNIFYDDFAETIPSTKNHPRKQSINFFFSDEPPPDSFDDDTISEPENEKSSTKINAKLISKTNKPNIISSVVEKEANISESDQTEPDNSILSVSELIKKVGTEQTYSKPKTNTSIPKKLHRNLDINVAALIPGAKRPSMKTNEDFKVHTSVDDNESSLMSKIVEAPEEDQSCITPKPNTSKDVFDPNRLQSLNKTRAKIQVKRHPSTRKGRQESLKKSLSLDINADSSTNDITDADDTKSDTEEAELFSETINHESNESIMKFTVNNLNVNSQIISTQQNSDSLGDFNQSLDDDWLTKSIQIEKSNNPIEINQKTSENSIKSINKSIAVEESDDDDDLFASALKTTASKVSQPPPSYMEEKQKKLQKQDIRTNTNTNASIFHDDSDDGLFGNAQKQKTTDTLYTLAKEKVIEKTKIFSSDEDDDDIFSKSFKTAKKLENNAPMKLAVPTSQSLFGDDDDEDDDDLFGPTTTKTKSKVTHTFKAPKKQEKKSPVGSITDDNPLADLLNG